MRQSLAADGRHDSKACVRSWKARRGQKKHEYQARPQTAARPPLRADPGEGHGAEDLSTCCNCHFEAVPAGIRPMIGISGEIRIRWSGSLQTTLLLPSPSTVLERVAALTVLTPLPERKLKASSKRASCSWRNGCCYFPDSVLDKSNFVGLEQTKKMWMIQKRVPSSDRHCGNRFGRTEESKVVQSLVFSGRVPDTVRCIGMVHKK